MTKTKAPVPFTSMRALRAAVQPGSVIQCTEHPALPPHTRTVTRFTTQGFYFTPSYASSTHRLFFPWPLRELVTFNPDGSFTVAYAKGPATFRLLP